MSDKIEKVKQVRSNFYKKLSFLVKSKDAVLLGYRKKLEDKKVQQIRDQIKKM